MLVSFFFQWCVISVENIQTCPVLQSCQPVLQLEHNISSIVCFGHYIVYYATWSCSSHGCDAMSQQGSHLTTDMLWYIMTYWEKLPLNIKYTLTDRSSVCGLDANLE